MDSGASYTQLKVNCQKTETPQNGSTLLGLGAEPFDFILNIFTYYKLTR